jgi:hypothetical protein
MAGWYMLCLVLWYIPYSIIGGVQNLEFQKQVDWYIFKCLSIGNIHIPVAWNAEVRREGRKLPVVVLSHGLGTSRFFYSTMCLELASHGFVVAAVEHRWAWVTCVELKYDLQQETNIFYVFVKLTQLIGINICYMHQATLFRPLLGHHQADIKTLKVS